MKRFCEEDRKKIASEKTKAFLRSIRRSSVHAATHVGVHADELQRNKERKQKEWKNKQKVMAGSIIEQRRHLILDEDLSFIEFWEVDLDQLKVAREGAARGEGLQVPLTVPHG